VEYPFKDITRIELKRCRLTGVWREKVKLARHERENGIRRVMRWHTEEEV